jgi:hypothetical protein
MKKTTCLLFLLIQITISGQNKDDGFSSNVKKWFAAWELVSKKIYQLYTTSAISGKDGESIKGPALFGKELTWIKKKHDGKFIQPNGEVKNIDMMCYAIPLYNNNVSNAFFVMPIINYWVAHDIGDHGIGYEKLTTCVFVHEFCHTQQFEKGMNGMEAGAFDTYFTAHENEVYMDDIMQDIYGKDSAYTNMFNEELQLFTKAHEANNKTENKILAKKAISALEQRQKNILMKDKRDLAEIDNYWLTIEGVAQYSAYAWLKHPEGGQLSDEAAFKALKTKSWSQEEGIALVYLYSKLVEPKKWARKMFRSKTVTMVSLLKKEVVKL